MFLVIVNVGAAKVEAIKFILCISLPFRSVLKCGFVNFGIVKCFVQ